MTALTPVSLHTSQPKGSLKDALRLLAGGVTVITTGAAPHRTGLTATSTTSLSLDPPRILVSINKGSSSYAVLRESGFFAANFLSAEDQPVADAFAGVGGLKGEERYAGRDWHTLVSGASVLSTALAVVDCEVEDIIERHSHAIVIGRVVAVQAGKGEPLVYWQGQYRSLA
jgi:flavin reductase (DIM6/NTAB) family NADH-FMN oxidoreductase RutF